MNRTKKIKIFIAHAEERQDSTLAKALKDLLVETLSCQPDEIFCSTGDSIKSYEQFQEAITEALNQSVAILVLLTPNSMWRPWVHFESGGGHFSSEKDLFVLSAFGIEPNSVPANLMFYSVKSLGDKEKIKQLLNDLGTKLGLNIVIDEKKVKKLTVIAKRGISGWNLIQPAMISKKTSRSPFQLTKLIKDATKQVFVSGQNLFSLTVGRVASEAESCIFDFLNKKSKKSNTMVQLLLQNPNYEEGIEVWTSLFSGFRSDLEKSVEKLHGWLKRANSEGFNRDSDRRLDIRVASLVPVSFNFIDPEEPNGKMLCTPVLHRGPQSELRPVLFLCGGKNNEVLTYYWDIWKLAFKEAVPLDYVSI